MIFPRDDARVARQPQLDFAQLEAGGSKLLGDGLATHARFLRGELRGLHRLTRGVHAVFGLEAGFVELAQLVFGIFERAARGRQLAFYFEATLQRIRPSARATLRSAHRRSKLAFELGDALRERALAVPSCAQGRRSPSFRWSGGTPCAPSRSRAASCACWAAEQRDATISRRSSRSYSRSGRRESSSPRVCRPRSSSPRARGQCFLRHADFAGDFGPLLFEAGTAQRRLLRAGARGFELAEKIRVLPVSALDTGLRAIALPLGIGQRLTHGAEMRLHAFDALFGSVEFRAERLEAVLALDDAAVTILTAADTQPVTAEPFALPRDDRLARR